MAIAALLILGFIFQNFKKQFEIDANGVFVPLSIIEQSEIIYKALQNEVPENSPIFPCGDRTQRILSEKISVEENISSGKALNKLVYLWSEYVKSQGAHSCKNFPEIVDAGYLLKKSLQQGSKISLKTQARQLYSQNLIWNSQIYCVYGKDELGKFLLYGKPSKCDEVSSSSQNSAERINLREFLSPILSLSKNRAVNSELSEISHQSVTLDPKLQLLFQGFENCGANNNQCSTEMASLLRDVDYATFTLMDASNREVLAAGCYGSVCKSESKYISTTMAGMGIESPPASTEKLLYAYAIAKGNPSLHKDLALQIKTSGELDGQVSKRNEWWERQAICNPKSANASCGIPNEVISFAKNIGWEQNCSTDPSLLCGNSNLLSAIGLQNFSPTSGRVLVDVDKKGFYINEQLLKRTYIPWSEYESIRSGKATAKNYKSLESTSLAIQSVIGAGNNRTTSLGLTLLASGIYQSAHYGKITEAALFKKIGEKTSGTVSSSSAAQAVLIGMQKVMTPAEPGWTGDGTASNAFKLAFGKACDSNCPMYGKTGTVSFKDKNHSGTTLFTGIIKENELRKFIGKDQSGNTRVLALGVICQPKKSNTGHHASKLGLLITKEIVSQAK
jgi:hypothetical protein